MSVRARSLPRRPAVALSRGKAPGYWGMWMLIFTEAVLFSILLTSYFFIRFRHQDWPLDDLSDPDLKLVSIMTPILLLSSLPAHWAELSIRQGRVGRLRIGLAVAFAMAATFLGLQAYEYTHLLEEFTPQTNVYGSLFFTITAFHGLHVLVGLLMNLWLQVFAWRGFWTAERHLPVQAVTLYWHFVDVVWVFILVSLYLSPYFWP